MWIKLSGVLLVVAACAGLGAEAAFRLKKRLRLLEGLKLMINHLKGEILYANAPLPEAFERTGSRNRNEAGALFIEVAKRMREATGDDFAAIWKAQAEGFVKNCVLGKNEREQLLRFGEHLGYLDREMQERTILFYLEELDFSIGRLREQEAEKCRLFMSLGLMSGMFLAVVLI